MNRGGDLWVEFAGRVIKDAHARTSAYANSYELPNRFSVSSPLGGERKGEGELKIISLS